MSSTTLSGGSPPLLCPRSIDPRVGWNRSPTRAAASISALQHVAPVAREDVVVVGRRGAPGAGQPGQPAGGRGVHQVGVDPPPHRVQRGQPAEQGVVHGQTAGDPLVQVVVGVDEAGGDQAAGRVDVARRPDMSRGAGPVADGGDQVVGDDHVTAGVLGSAGVDGGDVGAVAAPGWSCHSGSGAVWRRSGQHRFQPGERDLPQLGDHLGASRPPGCCSAGGAVRPGSRWPAGRRP